MKDTKNTLQFALCNAFMMTSIIKLAAFLKVNVILGSFFSCFSGINFVTPLAGAFDGVRGSFLTVLFRISLAVLVGSFTTFKFLAFIIPGFIASLYWSTQSAAIRVLIPAVCMVLFWLHPEGQQAFPYALYWFVPIILYFVQRKNIFLQSLGSTFIAHAVGSVIWIYTVQMSAAQWMLLIPIVAIERILFASGMAIAYHAIQYVVTTVSTLVQNKTKSSVTLNQ